MVEPIIYEDYDFCCNIIITVVYCLKNACSEFETIFTPTRNKRKQTQYSKIYKNDISY